MTHRLATMHSVTDRQTNDRRTQHCIVIATISRPIRSAKNYQSNHRENLKFRTMLGPRLTGCSVMTSSQMQDGGRLLTWKSLCRHISVTVIWLWLNLIHWLRYTLINMVWTKFSFKFNMTHGRHIENLFFFTITRQWIVGFSQNLLWRRETWE